jgi:hypothetical protein
MNQPVPTNQPGVRGRPAVILLHRLPTRLRLGLPALREGAEYPLPETESDGANPDSTLTDVAEAAVGDVEGVTSAKVNPVTGSLLIEHDGAPGREEAILAALYTVLPSGSQPPNEPHLLNNMRRAGEALNQATLRASKGQVDLNTVLPLLLATYGLSRLLTERPIRPPSGLTMVWWAYTSMRQLARESRR